MRIAAIQETYAPFLGGSSYRAHEVLKRLVARGHEVDVYTARLSLDLKTNEVIDGVHVYRIETPRGLLKPQGGFRSISDMLRLTTAVFWRLLASKKHYDIYEVDEFPLVPVFAVQLVSWIRGVPVAVTFHEVWNELWFKYIKNKAVCRIGIFLEKLTTRMGDRLIAVSSVTGERLMTRCGVPSERIIMISNGVDLSMFQSGSFSKVPYKIIYLGRLNRHKNVDLLIRAYERVKSAVPEATLGIAGDGPEREGLEAMSKGIPGVTFHGAVTEEEKVRLFCSAWLYVLPSVREGQGITLLEAMASATPTIAAFYEGSGVVSVIHDGANGLLVKPEPEDIANAILRYQASPEFYARVQAEGLRFVRAFDWDAIALQHESLYRSMMTLEETDTVPSLRPVPGGHSLDNALK